MDITALAEILIGWLSVYGPQTLALAALLGALGVPMPAQLLLIASGALVRQGTMSPVTAVLAWTAGCGVAEGIFYLAGRRARQWTRRRGNTYLAGVWSKAEGRFAQRPGLTLYLTRWLITPLGIPTNVIAGSNRYPYLRFLLISALGDVTGLLMYALPGYIIGAGWRAASGTIGMYGALLTGVLVAGAAAICLARRHGPVLWNAIILRRRPCLSQGT